MSLKRPLTAYFFFAKEQREKLKDQKLTVPEVGRTIGKAWTELTEKDKYQELAKKDRERYKTEVEKLKADGLPLPTRRKIKHRKKKPVVVPEEPEQEQ